MSRTLNLEFPAAGLDRRVAYQHQRPYTTPAAVNVRAVDPLEERRRGGSRPDLVKKFTQELGSGSPVNMLTTVRTTGASAAKTFNDVLDDATHWDAASWAGSGLPTFSGSKATSAGDSTERGAVLKNASIPSNIDQAAVRTLSMYIDDPSLVQFYELYGNMDDTSPLDTDSVRAFLFLQSDGKVELRIYVDAVIKERYEWNYGLLRPGWLSLEIGVSSLVARWKQDSGNDVTITYSGSLGAVAGDCAGFVLYATTGSSAASADEFRYEYFDSTGGPPPEAVVAAAGGTLYHESPEGTLSAATTQLALETDYPLQCVTRLGKVYIADWATTPRSERTAKHDDANIVDSGTYGTLTDTGTTWNTAGTTQVLADGDVIEITDGTGTVTNGWYKIRSVESDTEITLDNLDGTNWSGANTHTAYRIVPGLKVYDPATDAVTLWTKGNGLDGAASSTELPYGCRLISKHLDRMVLSGDDNNPGVVWFSAQGAPDDWDQSVSDTRSAVTMGTADDVAETIGAPVTALVDFTRDYHIAATAQDCWLVRGDLRFGGGIGRMSGTIGMVGPFAYTVTDDNTLYFLSSNGLYMFTEQAAASGAQPTLVSQERVPQELRNIDTDLYVPVVGRNPSEFGVYIWDTPLTVGAAAEWFLDPRASGWFEDNLDSDHQVFSTAYLNRSNQMLVGCRDGYVRTYDMNGAGDDDGTARTQEVDYGPIPLNGGKAAMVDSVEIVMAADSDDVTWTFRTGQSPEEAFDAATRATGTASGGVNYRQPVRHYGQFGFLNLSTTAAARWAIESIKLRVSPADEQRKW